MTTEGLPASARADNAVLTQTGSEIAVAAFEPETKAWLRLSTTLPLHSNAAMQ